MLNLIPQTKNWLRANGDRPVAAKPFSSLSSYKAIKHHQTLAKTLGIPNPFYRSTEGMTDKLTLIDSKARADVGPEADAVFSIRKNGVQFATCTFDTGVTTGAFVCPADTTFDPDSDDELTIVAPDPMDSLLRRPRMTLTGFRPAT